MAQKIVVAYSGGLDTTVAVRWLTEMRGFDVIAVPLDLGSQPKLETIRERALAGGAVRAYVLDARQPFIERFCWPALKAGALYQGQYPLATALGRPLIAQLLVEVAARQGATWVGHGSTGKGNDQVRFDVAVGAINPQLKVLAPLRDGMSMTREEEIAYARAKNLPIEVKPESPYSVDENLWGRSIEAGVLEDALLKPPEDLVLDAEVGRFKASVAAEYARLVYQGKWFTSHRRDLDTYVQSTQSALSGTVRVKLHKGSAQVIGRSSPYSLYRPQLATYSAGDQFDHQAAVGFIKLVGLPVRTQAAVQGSAVTEPLLEDDRHVVEVGPGALEVHLAEPVLRTAVPGVVDPNLGR